LQELDFRSQLNTHAFVLMKNHFHLLCSAHLDTLATSIDQIYDRVEQSILMRLQTEEPVFERTSFCIPMKDYHQYREVYRYIYRNPVKAGIVRNAEEYSFSTLRILLGLSKDKFFFDDPMGIIFDQSRLLTWINSEFTDRRPLGR